LSISLVGALGAYVEYAGFFPLDSGFDELHYLFGALTLLLSARLQLGLGAGQGLNSADPDYFVSAGFVYRW
jgi:hypothetical protein